MRILFAIVALAALQAPPPGNPEVFLASLTVKTGAITAGTPRNISNSPGYDNQPAFLPDGSAVLFTSDRSRVVTAPVVEGPAATPRTDIYRYDLASGRVTQVTDTIEGEYSPTVTPDGRGISVIRVEQDGTQRLWRFTLDGKSAELLLADVKPVGYHAWIDEHRLALFVLGGRGEPATLQLADTRTGKAVVVARDVGRSIQRMPSGGVSFVQRGPGAGEETPGVRIMRFDPAATGTARFQILAPPVAGVMQPDVAWTPDGTLLMASGATLYAWHEGDRAWRAVADFAGAGLRNISRLAVSAAGDRIALVAEGAAPQ